MAHEQLFDAMPDEDWWAYGRDPANSRHTPLKQISEANFDQLELKWTWDLPTSEIDLEQVPNTQFGPNEGTPIKVGDYLYVVTAASQVAKFDLNTGGPALDSSGLPIVYDAEIWKDHSLEMIGFLHRGAAYWQSADGNCGRIFLTRGDGVLLALDLEDLTPIPSFGENGQITLYQHKTPVGDPLRYGNTSPPLVCRNHVIVGSSMPDLNYDPNPPKGDVFAFDALTGNLEWVFETIPDNRAMLKRGIDPEAQWGANSNIDAAHANVWSLMSADEEANIAYLPVGSAYNDAYGGARPGNNIYSQSLVALNVTDGSVVWHQQLIHHGVWDYDPPCAPNLLDIVDENGTTTKLVAIVTKQAFTYVFDRLTGEPRWDLIECTVPDSTVPGEELSGTQPVPSKPLPFDHQGVFVSAGVDLLGRPVETNLIDLHKALREKAEEVLSNYTLGTLFTPPSLEAPGNRGTIQVPGFLGGASWAGAVVNPTSGQLFVSSVTREFNNAVKAQSDGGYFSAGPASWGIRDAQNNRYQLPLLKPPWGRITAIDLKSGEHTWKQPTPVGEGPRKALEQYIQMELPPGELGWNRRTHLLTNENLVFAAQEAGRRPVGFTDEKQHTLVYKMLPEPDELRNLQIFDQHSGRELGRVPIPQHAQGALMSFAHGGQQYIAIPAGGFDLPHQIFIYGLRSSSRARPSGRET